MKNLCSWNWILAISYRYSFKLKTKPFPWRLLQYFDPLDSSAYNNTLTRMFYFDWFFRIRIQINFFLDDRGAWPPQKLKSTVHNRLLILRLQILLRSVDELNYYSWLILTCDMLCRKLIQFAAILFNEFQGHAQQQRFFKFGMIEVWKTNFSCCVNFSFWITSSRDLRISWRKIQRMTSNNTTALGYRRLNGFLSV